MKCSPDFAGIQLAFTVAFSSTIGTACGGGTGLGGRDTLLGGKFVVEITWWSMETDKRRSGTDEGTFGILCTPPAQSFRVDPPFSGNGHKNRKYIHDQV